MIFRTRRLATHRWRKAQNSAQGALRRSKRFAPQPEGSQNSQPKRPEASRGPAAGLDVPRSAEEQPIPAGNPFGFFHCVSAKQSLSDAVCYECCAREVGLVHRRLSSQDGVERLPPCQAAAFCGDLLLVTVNPAPRPKSMGKLRVGLRPHRTSRSM